MAQDPYTELGVAKGASQAEIKKAFHKLAKELHPDRNPGDKKGEERFKRVSAAFDFLSDEEKRQKVDRGEIDADGREVFRGFSGARRGPGGGPGAGFNPGGFSSTQFDPADLEDIFSVFGGLGGAMGGRGGARPQPSPQGVDVRAKLDIDLEDTIEGATKRIGFNDGRTLDVTIPKGASDGQTLRLKGQGQQGRGGAFGDALIELKVRPHPVFKREGSDLSMDLPVSIPDAVLGGKVEAPTPDGPVSLNVPKGSNTGAVLRLKGKGAYDAKSGKRGDLMARLVVTLPDKPDPELEKFAETWRKERPYTPRRKG